MAYSSFCFFKRNIETLNIGVQTESTEYTDFECLVIQSPGSKFSPCPYGEMIKLMSCQGDLDDFGEITDKELFVIDETNSFDDNFLLNSFVEDDVLFMSPQPKLRKTFADRKFEEKNSKNSEKYKKSKKFGKKNKFRRKVKRFRGRCIECHRLSDSYEEMIENFECNNDGFKKSFIQLIKIEKKSIKNQFYKKRVISELELETNL